MTIKRYLLFSMKNNDECDKSTYMKG